MLTCKPQNIYALFIVLATGIVQMFSQDLLDSRVRKKKDSFGISSSIYIPSNLLEKVDQQISIGPGCNYEHLIYERKCFLLTGGVQYFYVPLRYEFKYYHCSSLTPLQGVDEVNITFHSANLRIRPGFKIMERRKFDLTLLASLSLGFYVMDSYSHKNRSPEYSYTLNNTSEQTKMFSNLAFGFHINNMFHISREYSMGIDIGYSYNYAFVNPNPIVYSAYTANSTTSYLILSRNIVQLTFMVKI